MVKMVEEKVACLAKKCFILKLLKNYLTWNTFFNLMKKILENNLL